MLLHSVFGNKRAVTDLAHHIYGAVVAAARQPVFFAERGVADTVMGRFELLSMHLFLLLHELRHHQSDQSQALSQAIFDCYTADVDRSLRELGIGDTSVPKRAKRMVATFYAMVDAFEAPLAAGDKPSLSKAVNQRMFMDGNQPCAESIAHYMLDVRQKLANSNAATIYEGKFTWPKPGERSP